MLSLAWLSDTVNSTTTLCATAGAQTDLGARVDEHLQRLVPWGLSGSVLVARMNRRDPHGMPPIGSHRVDEAGVALVGAWIDSK